MISGIVVTICVKTVPSVLDEEFSSKVSYLAWICPFHQY